MGFLNYVLIYAVGLLAFIAAIALEARLRGRFGPIELKLVCGMIFGAVSLGVYGTMAGEVPALRSSAYAGGAMLLTAGALGALLFMLAWIQRR